MSSDEEEDPGEQIRISLRPSRDCNESLTLSSEPIAVPASIGRKGLSAVVNHLLERENIIFEFIVGNNSTLLRTGLEKEARRSGLSLEEAIPVTYFPSANAPESRGESEMLPDWISTMSLVNQTLVSGCYDGSLYMFRTTGKALEQIKRTQAHQGPVKCVAADTDKDGQLWIASGSMDHTVKVFNGDLEEYAQAKNGHASSVGCVDLYGSCHRLASGDWDGSICLWELDQYDEQPAAKKSKGGNPTHSLTPIRFQAHSDKVSGVAWGNFERRHHESPTNLITASWDHSIKLWDVERQDCLTTINGSRVFSCIDTSHHSKGVVASGHPDCTIRLWDIRAENSKDSSLNVTDNTFRPSHKAWVTSVKWSTKNPYHLASTSHDGTIKFWDIRSSTPLHTVRSFDPTEKAFCLSIGERDGVETIYAGGTDKVVKEFVIPAE